MKKLKELRIKYKYSVNEVADLVGISSTYYWQIENKKRRLYYNLAIRIANAFNLKPDDIFYDEF